MSFHFDSDGKYIVLSQIISRVFLNRMSSETELIRSLQLQVEELKAKLADVQTAPRRSKVIILILVGHDFANQ